MGARQPQAVRRCPAVAHARCATRHDHRTRTVRRGGQPVDLTAVEYSLLERLLRSPGRILERGDLVKDVLHRELSPFDRSIDTHVSNLRKKLGHQVNGVERIKTVRSVGYIYAKSDE